MIADQILCDRHAERVGDPYPVRCSTCDSLTAEWNALNRATVRYEPDSRCPLHEGYPLPCDLCRRIRRQRFREG